MKIKRSYALLLAISVFFLFFINYSNQNYSPSNSLMVITPYKYSGTWVFDDSKVGLVREPFVAGTPEMIDKLVANIPSASEGFRLLFSTQPFPDYDLTFKWLRSDGVGNWYLCKEYNTEGWLCPGLFKYYKDAPENIYIKAEKK